MKVILEIIGWIATALSLTGNVGVLRKRSWGMLSWTVANVLWITYDVAMQAYPQAFLFLMYLCLSVYGLISWRRDERKRDESVSSKN